MVVGIQSHDGTKEDDGVIWKILKSLTPPFMPIAQMIQLVMPYTKDFTKQIFLGRLESIEVNLRQSREF